MTSSTTAPSQPHRTGQQVTLVRHGETDWSAARKHTGHTDIPLTDHGRDQAKRLGARLAGRSEPYALVLTSPLSRATETCRLAGLASRAVVTEDLVEWDYGAYEGRRTTEIREERPGWLLWTDGAPAGETAADVGRRVERVVDQARAAPGDVVLFAHGHVLRTLAARWLGLSPTYGAYLALDTAAICHLGWEREVPVIRSWNEQSHLD